MEHFIPRHEEGEHAAAGNSTAEAGHHHHHSNHYINVKYGYFILLVSALYLFVRLSLIRAYFNRWINSGRSRTGLKLVEFISFPVGMSLAFVSLVIISLWNFNREAVTIHFKRWGRISYALLPLDILLSIRPSPFKIDNYLDNLKIHKWLSRIIVFFGVLHSFGFIIIWIVKHTFTKVFQGYILFSTVAFFGSVLLLVIGWRPFRSLSYNLFYIVHNITVFGFVILLNFHAQPHVYFLSFISTLLLIYQFIIKIPFGSKTIELKTIITNERSDLKIIKINKNEIVQSFNRRVINFNQEFFPGCHLRLGYSMKNYKFWLLPTHPFSYGSSIYDINKSQFIDLIVKTSRFDIKPYDNYTIQPFFQTSIPQPFFQTVDNLTIVAGGTGISFGISIFNYFKNKILSEHKDLKLKLIWIVPSSGDLYILNHLDIKGIDIYITGSKDRSGINGGRSTESSNPFLGDEEIELRGSEYSLDDEDDEMFELESLDELDNNDPFTDPNALTEKNNIFNFGKRPNLEELISRRLRLSNDNSNKWVISCGPKQLNAECEKIAKRKKVRYFVESYSM